jgi:hypothetical protein
VSTRPLKPSGNSGTTKKNNGMMEYWNDGMMGREKRPKKNGMME